MFDGVLGGSLKMMKIGQRVLGRYDVEDLVSEGGQCCVAKGKDRKSGQMVAIRQLTAAPKDAHYATAVARFRREASINISHPHLLVPIEFSQEGNAWYHIVPFIEGPTLGQRVFQAGGRLSVKASAQYVTQIASALSACHDHGVIHRDVKSDNVLIDAKDRAYLIDFGICTRLSEATLTAGDGLLGTLHWLSPEQVIDPRCRDPRLDLYTLGALLYFCLTGQLPVRGETPEEIALSICQWMPPAPSEVASSVPHKLDRVCMRLLSKNPRDRFQTAREIQAALSGRWSDVSSRSGCPSCGKDMASDARFCTTCGARRDHGSVAMVRCLACGATVDGECECPGCARPFSPADHRLAFHRGALTGVSFRAPEGKYHVGRDILAPRDFHISRRHIRVVCRNGDLCLSDDGSANKTYVNGQPATKLTRLGAGSSVRIAFNEANYSFTERNQS